MTCAYGTELIKPPSCKTLYFRSVNSPSKWLKSGPGSDLPILALVAE